MGRWVEMLPHPPSLFLFLPLNSFPSTGILVVRPRFGFSASSESQSYGAHVYLFICRLLFGFEELLFGRSWVLFCFLFSWKSGKNHYVVEFQDFLRQLYRQLRFIGDSYQIEHAITLTIAGLSMLTGISFWSSDNCLKLFH